LHERVISSKNGAYTEKRVKNAKVHLSETITQEKIIRILIQPVDNQQRSV